MKESQRVKTDNKTAVIKLAVSVMTSSVNKINFPIKSQRSAVVVSFQSGLRWCSHPVWTPRKLHQCCYAGLREYGRSSSTSWVMRHCSFCLGLLYCCHAFPSLLSEESVTSWTVVGKCSRDKRLKLLPTATCVSPLWRSSSNPSQAFRIEVANFSYNVVAVLFSY